MSTRRDLLTALIALAAAPALGVVAAPFSDLDRDAVRRQTVAKAFEGLLALA